LKKSNLSFLILLLASPLLAQLSPVRLAGAPLDHPLNHLREFDESVYSGQKAFVSMKSHLAFSPRQFPQQSEMGTLYGYPFYQHFAFSSTADSPKGKPLLGLQYAYSRQGWDKNDFLFSPDESYGSHYRSNHMVGVNYSSFFPGEWLLSLGYSYSDDSKLSFGVPENKENHRLFTHVQLFNLHLSAMGLSSIELARIYWYGEQRSYDPKMKMSWKTYLPRLGLEYRDDYENWSVGWEQNLYERRFYSKTQFDLSNGEWLYSDLRVYFDPTRFFWTGVSFAKNDKDFVWGWNLQLGLLEVGYQWAEDLEKGLPWRGSTRVGISISLATLVNRTFRSGSAALNLKEEEVQR
jgi:hypothetical protein